MSAKSKIEWTDSTWNPVTGCTKVSEGCRNCYAERIARRFCCEPFDEVETHPERLDVPMHWKQPRRVFVCSMSDLFHKDVPDEFITEVFLAMNCAQQHTFMVLTKRPERMFQWERNLLDDRLSGNWPLPNLWLGVTAENQAMADERIPLLLQTPAVVRFVSIEPMLERIDLTHDLDGYKNNGAYGAHLDWCIAGAESGPGARSFEMKWAADLKHQCVMNGVPFFFKQARIDGQLVKMPELDGRVWDQYPETK